MPQFSFRVLDPNGRPTEGRLDGASAQDVVRRLTADGFRVLAVQTVKEAAMPQAPALRRSAPDLVPAAAAGVGSSLKLDAPPVEIHFGPGDIVRTRRASRTRLIFIYRQLQSYAKGGVGLNLALERLANQRIPGFLSQALQDMGRRVGQGASLADQMERYPDIFPPGDAGAVRAGEVGGYLPRALAGLADRQDEARRVNWWVRIVRWEILGALIVFPFVVAWTAATRLMIDDAVNSSVPMTVWQRLKFLFSEATSQMLSGLPGAMLITGVIVYLAISIWARQSRQRKLRDRIGMALPLFGYAARNENMAEFSLHMESLSAAGISPHRAWALAARAVPNTAYADRLTDALRGASDQTSFGEIILRSGALSDDVAPLIVTGEATGSLPEAFRQVSSFVSSSVQNSRRLLRTVLVAVGVVVTAVIVTFALAHFYTGYYQSVFDSAFKDTPMDPNSP